MSLTEQATRELAKINMGEEDTAAILSIMKTFFNHWDSGGAVSVALPILVRCLRGQPLSPLTGAEDEWIDHSEMMDEPYFQNMRCSSVFRRKNPDGSWRYHDIDTDKDVTMPYTPPTSTRIDTVFEVEVSS